MNQPVFIFGAGRCGSTLIQRVINASDRAMIWGEHGGLLKHLASMHRQYMTSEEMARNLFDRRTDFLKMADRRRLTMADSAWFNLFGREDLKRHTRDHIEGLFRSRLPPGVTHWGFKEIRYGGDGVIEMLMELYPNAKLIFCVREPFASIRSMVLNWGRGLFGSSTETTSIESLRRCVLHHAQRWQKSNVALLESIEQFGSASIVLRQEDASQECYRRVLGFLDLEVPQATREILDHRLSPAHDAWKRDLVERLLHESRGRILDMVAETGASIGYALGSEVPSMHDGR